MPNPGTLSALSGASAGLQFFGALSSAYGAYASARAQRNQLKFQSSMDQINAQLAEKSAEGALLTGQAKEQAQRLRTANLKSTQRNNLTANGIDLSSGTAQNILNTTDIMGDIDANTIAANAVRSAWGYRTQAVNYNNNANMESANASGINPASSAFTSMLGSATQVAPMWYQLSKMGAA